MFDLNKIGPVIQHLKRISPNMFNNMGSEIQIHCSFCDDALRTRASDHGHMYLATNAPVFNCFRCSTSGTLIQLLVETDFDDEDVLEYIASFIKIKSIKNYSKKSKISLQNIKLMHSDNINRLYEFKKNNTNVFYNFQEYIYSRLGRIDYNSFLLYPQFVKIGNTNSLCCSFNNINNVRITSRSLEKNAKRRYKNHSDNDMYYFQPKNFHRYKSVVLAEGPFDVLNLYLFSNMFRDSLFFSINGKKYVSALEKLITQDMLIGDYEVNLIFDMDFTRAQNVLYRCKVLAQKYNENIEVRGYTPISPFNDTGDFPQVMEI